MAKLEKMKRKWYKTNVDREFNPDGPASSGQSTGSSTAGTNTNQNNQAPPPPQNAGGF